jgi:hypothetical protein
LVRAGLRTGRVGVVLHGWAMLASYLGGLDIEVVGRDMINVMMVEWCSVPICMLLCYVTRSQVLHLMLPWRNVYKAPCIMVQKERRPMQMPLEMQTNER